MTTQSNLYVKPLRVTPRHICFHDAHMGTVESHDANEIQEPNITFIKTKKKLSISTVQFEALEQRDTSKPFNRNANKPSPTQTYFAVVGLSSISCGSEWPVSKPPNTENVIADNENNLVVPLINSAHGTKTIKKKQVVLETGAAGFDSASTLMMAEKLSWIHVGRDSREATKSIVQEHLKKRFFTRNL
ncbi:hypothetical protein HHI36_020319 [Cryptolaemus montrouzieri]|uniref:Uncharacterized protein n=1 Tax=Cryptolaemus montrouzieri TaxID=559131 RepID=A0ABD2N9W3_9CUCU